MNIKAALCFIFALFFFPNAVAPNYELTAASFFLALFCEFLLGLVAGLALQLSFAVLQMAGELIGFTMGFSIASVLDPNTGTQTPVISQVIYLIALLMFLGFDGHHALLLAIAQSKLALGSFALDESLISYLIKASAKVYLLGFMLAFPIIAMSLLADFIFGILMKTMPQFNLLVVGYPLKIGLSFFVLTSVLAAIMLSSKGLIIAALGLIARLFNAS